MDKDGRAAAAAVLWAIAEISGNVYDAYDTVTTVLDPNASARDKTLSVTGMMLGVMLPGSGYGAVAKAAAKKADDVVDGIRAAQRADDGIRAATRTVDELSQAAGTVDKSGLSSAGRALQKHGGREGSAFPAVKGSKEAINKQAQNVVDEILTNPKSTQTSRHHARFGQVLEIKSPDGRGLRYDSSGKLIGFLEPNQ